MDTATALAWLESRPDITSLRAAVCDLNGILRGKRVPVAQAGKVLAGQMRMPYSIVGLDIWGEDIAGNPAAEVEVRTAPDGTIVGQRLIKSSGNKAWDSAVLRAIEKTETLPRDVDGRVPTQIVISFRPKD